MPVDIVARLEELMKQGEDYIWRPAAEAATEIRQLRREVARLEAVNAKLVEALEFYANAEVYKAHPHGPAFDDRDLSFVARAALAAAKEQP